MSRADMGRLDCYRAQLAASPSARRRLIEQVDSIGMRAVGEARGISPKPFRALVAWVRTMPDDFEALASVKRVTRAEVAR